QIATTTTATSYSDTTTTAGTSYSYRVRANDAAGNLGPYSNTASVSTPVPSGPAPVAAYAFDEGSGTTVSDLSGNGNNGTLANTSWATTGKYGGALSFNGTSSRVTIPDSASLHLSGAMTLEAWVKPTTVSSAWRDVIEKGNDDYYLMGTSDHSGVPGGGGTIGVTYGTTTLTSNTWTHLAVTYDKTTISLYVNGTQVSTLADTANLATSTDALTIGSDPFYGQYFSGLIDDLRIYNSALTQAQIQTDITTPVGSYPSAPGTLATTVTGSNEVDLTWGAATGSLPITGYQVERCQGAGCSTFAQIAAPTGTAYNDTGVTPSTAYSYRVRAVDSAGAGPYSNTATAFTGITISPRVTDLTVTRTQQFTAQGATTFTWSVDGVTSGNTSVGTITSTGLYTPSSTGVGTHTVTATTPDSRSASATVYVTNYGGTFTFHNDPGRTGENLNEVALTPSDVNQTTFGKQFSYPVDGLTFASPLYVANVNIPGKGFRNVVYVVTEHDSVYAFDADGLSSTPLWQRSFINPGAGVTPVPAADTGETGDIPNEIGITGTPVIDSATGTLYVDAATKEVSGGTTTYFHRLHALDITTGAERSGSPATIQASVPGTGTGSQGGNLSFVPLRQNQRSALLLSNGVVYLGFSSRGDQEPFHGWVLGYNATTLQQVMVYCSTPNGDDGGVWMSGDGVAADSAGSLYFITGDGLFDASSGGNDYGDSFVKMNTAGTVLDYFSPQVQSSLNSGDLDLGSGGVMLLPDQPGSHPHEMVSAGKNGTIYLVDRDNMGHFNSNSDQIVQSITNIWTDVSGGEAGLFSTPAYFNGSVYFSPIADTVQAFHLSNGLLTTTPTSHSAETYDGTTSTFGSRGGTLAISANGNTNGILWALESKGDTAPGILHAYDATNLGNELYNSSQAGARDTLDPWLKFTIPVVANGRVYVASAGQLSVYGLLP
ncbi:MAG: LamG-like jellyroll fold domain-containing protein, partial [Gaiellaceae bacterium]